MHAHFKILLFYNTLIISLCPEITPLNKGISILLLFAIINHLQPLSIFVSYIFFIKNVHLNVHLSVQLIQK